TMSTENVDLITPAQCRGARGLLGLTQPALASKAKLGLSTIVDFERSRRPVSREAVQDIRKNLEPSGIAIIHPQRGGPPARAPPRPRPAKATKKSNTGYAIG